MSVLFSKALPGQCRWFVCEGDKPRVCGATTSKPTSYCLGHRLVVYERSQTAHKPPLEFTLLRRPPEPETHRDLTEIFG